MSRTLKIRSIVALLALFAAAFVFDSQAEARRYRGRGFYRGPAVYGSVYRGPAFYGGGGVSVRAPFVAVDTNRFGGTYVRAPFVRVRTF